MRTQRSTMEKKVPPMTMTRKQRPKVCCLPINVLYIILPSVDHQYSFTPTYHPALSNTSLHTLFFDNFPRSTLSLLILSETLILPYHYPILYPFISYRFSPYDPHPTRPKLTISIHSTTLYQKTQNRHKHPHRHRPPRSCARRPSSRR